MNLSLTTATGLEIKDGSTLNVVDTLPDLTGPAVTVTKGNLTLGYNLPAAVKRVEVTEGVLTVGQGRAIGNGSKTARVQGDVDPPQPGSRQRLGPMGQTEPIGGQRQVGWGSLVGDQPGKIGRAHV